MTDDAAWPPSPWFTSSTGYYFLLPWNQLQATNDGLPGPTLDARNVATTTIRIRKALSGEEQQVGGADNAANTQEILFGHSSSEVITHQSATQNPNCQTGRGGENKLAPPQSPCRLGGTACTRRLQRGFKNHYREHRRRLCISATWHDFHGFRSNRSSRTIQKDPYAFILQWLIRSVVERPARACGCSLVTNIAERCAAFAWSAQLWLTER